VQKAGFIDPKNIASITVLKSLAATNRYGSLGSNGAILITTKTASFGTTKEKKDLTLLTDNVYDGKIIVSNKTLVTPYLKELKKGKNVEEAYGIYLNQREQYWDDPAYFVDVFDFFKGSAEAVAYSIITNIIERELSSLIALKGMLFKMEMEENFELALETADAILKRNPDKIQSYLDLALAHKNVQNVQVAVNMLSAISDGTINPELDF
jgi:TonB-dependent SusC/RagA subfamily outer membrane receptor